MPLNCPPRSDGPRVNPHAQPCIASRLREARRCLADQADGPADALAPALIPLLGDVLARSWQRSAQAGLAPQGRRHGAPHASAAQLARAMQRQYELLSHAQPVLDYMAQQVAGTPSLLILADAQGMLLRTLGDDEVAGRAERVALRPGAQWAEAWRGTNAIGTALAEEAPVVVHGGQHYLERNGFLTCAAAPIIDPAGRLMGAFDISGEQRSHHPSSLGHTLGLARSAARPAAMAGPADLVTTMWAVRIRSGVRRRSRTAAPVPTRRRFRFRRKTKIRFGRIWKPSCAGC